MCRTVVYVLFCVFSWILCASVWDGLSDDPWDLDGPCQKYVEKFAAAQAQMVQCATNWSIPPKVCTNCFEPYINFKQIEYETHHLDNVFSLDNRTCAQVIYDNYVLSYSADISTAVDVKIWDSSRCDSCLHITWNFTKNDSRVSFSPRTINFQERLFTWRDCVSNYTDFSDPVSNESTICSTCKTQFNDLFGFYWQIYVQPGVDFCVDVETTMNDTMHLWNDVWGCSERKEKRRETPLVLYTFIGLAVITFVFYMGSYAQGERQTRSRLVQYSRLDPPRGQRSRLLSSSASEQNLSAHGSVYSNPVDS